MSDKLRKWRPPFLHMMTAREGGMPLTQSLASLMFVMLHDHINHNCLISTRDGIDTPADEWAYLPPKIANIFLMLAQGSSEETQRWIAEGSHEPYRLDNLGGEIVLRAPWTIQAFGEPDSPRRAESRRIVLEQLGGCEI